MPRELKRISIALTEENWRQLDELIKKLGENRSEVIKRALQNLHFLMFNIISSSRQTEIILPMNVRSGESITVVNKGKTDIKIR